MEDIVLNLSELYHSGRKELRNLLTSWIEKGLPDGFDTLNVKAVYSNGFLYLINDFDQCAALDDEDGQIKFWYNVGDEEGFLSTIMFECEPDDFSHSEERSIREAPEFENLLATGKYPKWQEDDEELEEDEEE